MERPVIRITFSEPRHGYWDGGKKSGGDFTPEPFLFGHPGKGHTIRWGSFYLNSWFKCGSGRSWKEAATVAKRRLCHLLRIPATVEIIYKEV